MFDTVFREKWVKLLLSPLHFLIVIVQRIITAILDRIYYTNDDSDLLNHSGVVFLSSPQHPDSNWPIAPPCHSHNLRESYPSVVGQDLPKSELLYLLRSGITHLKYLKSLSHSSKSGAGKIPPVPLYKTYMQGPQ